MNKEEQIINQCDMCKEKHENYFVLDIDKKTFFFVNKNKNKYGNDIELLFERKT